MRSQRILVALMAASLLVAGCSGRGGSGTEESAPPGKAAAVSSDFGDLQAVCQPGKATSSPTQGVTADQIQVGVFTDMGFTKNTELVDTAKVFSSWCNDNGGINGRKVTVNVRDAKLMEGRQRMLEACRQDFALVGGFTALDALGVKDRLSCTMPEFPSQVAMTENTGSDLQVGGGASASRPFDVYAGLHQWLYKEAYPNSASAVGIIVGDSPVTKVMADKYAEALPDQGATLVYSDLYPAAGVSDWTPYAQSIKTKGVKGLIFLGDFRSLAKLEDILTSMDYKLDWIDANSNAYNPAFIELAGKSLTAQNNFSDLSGTASLESANTIVAVKQAKDLFAKYAPGAELTYPGLRALTQWLLFAKSAASCGADLTRTCLVDTARKETAFTAGGLQAPMDMSSPTVAPKCFNVVKATPQGWVNADFKPNNGPYRCDMNAYVFKGDFGRAVTLADIGKSASDVK
ncbi:ABC transporter substrate-binding protein [Nocardia sp. NBC_00565]|uniref:ABC transporter substrate-binding protein n=1 Tax=Nocardia sp. NBC_00565 TaxID=2975993 RepID=UPI002E80CBB8|nr:ABC transporter substrate-binding protein [Nocardia sp. NBC_00565]WUC06331.1 ABC transporter substrate-binding protein [Nocardia sp. NBC_00565]